MAEYSIGEAIRLYLERNQLKSRADQAKLISEWESIAGSTIAKYTKNIVLLKGVLYLSTDIAPLKEELRLGKLQLMERINTYFKETVVKDIVLR